MVARPCHSPLMECILCWRMANSENIPELELAYRSLLRRMENQETCFMRL